MSNEKATFPDVKSVLPHRDPFLLISRVLECEPGARAVCELDLTGEEDFFRGHFPGEPVMPGVLIIESMAQAGGYALLSMAEFSGRLGFLAAIEKARFRKKVVPKGTLKLEATITRISGSFAKAEGRAFFEGQLAAEADMTFAIGK